jgi:transcriptional regulator with XRE-family HTH domain
VAHAKSLPFGRTQHKPAQLRAAVPHLFEVLPAGRTKRQVEFGERCGFQQTSLSRLERRQTNPTLNAMEVIANGLGLTILELGTRARALPASVIPAQDFY